MSSPVLRKPVVLACAAGLLAGGGVAVVTARSGSEEPGLRAQNVSAQTASRKKPTVNTAAPAARPGTIQRGAMVSFTFDDGKKNQYVNAMPVLDQAGLKGTFYVIGGAVEDWPEFRSQYMDPTELKTLAKNHEVGNHTWNHGNLADLVKGKSGAAAQAVLATEFDKTQKEIQKVIGKAPKTCAYPFGGVNSTVAAVAKQHLAACRTTASGLNAPGSDLFQLKIFYMTSKTTPAELQKALKDAKRQNKWMILCYHSVRPTDKPEDEYDVTTAAFKNQVQAVKASGIPVRTVSQALGLG
ncbi:MAG: hypothetical protein QG622_1963 [Actinomycetota bacterium]|nr:hypothetical protein [Actinomycetota bacterium]